MCVIVCVCVCVLERQRDVDVALNGASIHIRITFHTSLHVHADIMMHILFFSWL